MEQTRRSIIDIQNIDCIEFMRNIKDKQYSLCITDPPYNVGRKYNKHDDNMSEEKYEDWCDKWFKEALRVSDCVVLTPGYKNLKQWIKRDPKHIIIWHKPNQNSPSPIGGFNVYEPILIWGKGHKRIGHDLIQTNISIQKEADWHNCPKHLDSWIYIINKIIKGGSVFDPFMGSGTTAIACDRLGIDCYGCEIDEYYYRKSLIRISKYTNQQRLF